MAFELTKMRRLTSLSTQLKTIGSTFTTHWRELGEYILPRRPRFLVDDKDRGDRRTQKIINSTATSASNTLRSGMMAGITSPARAWFELTLPDADEDITGPVKQWLDEVTRRMNSVFTRSNLYKVLPMFYGDMGTFGLGGLIVEESFRNTILVKSLPIGSYYISNNAEGQVDTLFREMKISVRQIIEEYAMDPQTKVINWSVVSDYIKELWDKGQIEEGINVSHMVYPNPEYDQDALSSKYKKYSSCHWETGIGNNGRDYRKDERFLRESGYDIFPAMFGRWETTGEDAYPTNSPGITTLSDIKQLQFMEKRESKAVDKMIDPPMTVPVSLEKKRTSILPGDTTVVNSLDEANTYKPAHTVDYNLDASANKTAQISRRINLNYFVDLFKMLLDDQRNDRMTAAEVYARQQEKLQALGPVLEQLNFDLLDPLIAITFDIMNRQGLIPTPPQEIQGQPWAVKYVSIMAQAQKLIGVGTQERFLGILLQMAPVMPEVMDAVDIDKFVTTYANSVSLPYGIIRDPEAVQQIRGARAKAAMQQHNAEVAAQTAKAAKDLSGADMTQDSALTQLTQAARSGQLASQAS